MYNYLLELFRFCVTHRTLWCNNYEGKGTGACELPVSQIGIIIM